MWHARSPAASYLVQPDASHPANAWLYLCTDQSYALEKLSPVMRRNVRRGLSELTIASLTPEQLLAHGAPAFCETRRRVGLRDGTPEVFRSRFVPHATLPGRLLLAAWRGDNVAAFLEITEVDDWAEIECFSMDAFLQYRPNDTLLYSALHHYLVERRSRVVSYGLSSIHSESNASGLHRFKTKVGFQAIPVHRAFVLHPLLRPLINRATLWGMKAATQFSPRDNRLKLAYGTLASVLGDTHMLDVATGKIHEEQVRR
ncbi:MAG: hypothetical protein ACXWQR_13985 [Ktedonobacterales bacterium]